MNQRFYLSYLLIFSQKYLLFSYLPLLYRKQKVAKLNLICFYFSPMKRWNSSKFRQPQLKHLKNSIHICVVRLKTNMGHEQLLAQFIWSANSSQPLKMPYYVVQHHLITKSQLLVNIKTCSPLSFFSVLLSFPHFNYCQYGLHNISYCVCQFPSISNISLSLIL